ncbi:coiled-coil domain-containing protein 177-like [Astyanax mexicanus]|uniref:Coiled-coil domain containing 177 n=1 Tax=Astyanax mexicanus TaxID=7994 RepID=A0A8B9JA12_ASTMX|nr:coiled-coil domain-containing protein 177-like [Astyanax mexicanus]
MEDCRPGSPLMHLDLNNFDTPEAELSRYVLTSPRSLESCARLGVKPIDLLFKTLTEFMDEHQDTPMEALAALYEVYERGRRERVRLCRKERERIIQEGKEPVLAMKPFSGLETVLEQASETQSIDSKIKKCHSESLPMGKSRSAVGFAHDSLMTKTPSEPKSPYSSQLLPYSHSLGDLRHSPSTARKLGRLRQDICRKLKVTVPEKDCKIAALMLVKQEEEQAQILQSQREQQRREEAQKKEEVRRAIVEHRRRKELLRSLRRWHEDIEARRRQRQKEQAEVAQRQKWETLEQEERWRRRAEEQEERRRNQLEKARKEAEERTRRRENLLGELQRKEQAKKEDALGNAKVREFQARRSKSMKERRERQRLREENQRDQLRHSLLKREVEEKAQAEEEVRRNELERRLQRSEEKHSQLLEARLGDLRERAKKEAVRARRACLRACQEQKERQEAKEVLAQLSQRRADEAQQHVDQQSRSRVQQVMLENLEKEMRHRRLRKHVLKVDEAQLEQRRDAVALKEQRREQLRREREEALEKSRKVAHASSCMREIVREQSRSRTFQQMALQAELSAHLSRLKL